MDTKANETLGIAEMELEGLGAYHTANEIAQQPKLWRAVLAAAKENIAMLQKFISRVYSEATLEVILTGAGTSAFIGDVLEGPFQKNTGKSTKSIPTTDLVTHPELYFSHEKTILLISFARSGNSPESAQSIELAESLSKKVFHLIITCNRESELIAKMTGKEHCIFYMPPEADDKSLAMTGSFTSMLLGGILISKIYDLKAAESQVELICKYGEYIINEISCQLKKVASYNFERAVFLGSGPFGGVAREAHLKLQELTNGKVICIYDTFLGLRHGPKAVVNGKTLIFYIFSNESYVNQYELDLVKEISQGELPMYSIGIMEENLDVELDLKIVLSRQGKLATEDFLPVVSVLPAQLLGFYKSLHLGLQPDSPSTNGMIHRVVQDVNIYPFKRS